MWEERMDVTSSVRAEPVLMLRWERNLLTTVSRGMLSYVRATIHQYITYSPKSYILKVEDKKIRLKAFLVTFANSGQYGNNAYIAPNAIIDDGLLDLCILRPFPKTSTLELGLRLFFKNIDQSPYLEVMRIKKATLKRKGKQKITLHLDGEPVTLKRKLKVKVIPNALHVMVPATTSRRKQLLPLKGFRSDQDQSQSLKQYFRSSLPFTSSISTW